MSILGKFLRSALGADTFDVAIDTLNYYVPYDVLKNAVLCVTLPEVQPDVDPVIQQWRQMGNIISRSRKSYPANHPQNRAFSALAQSLNHIADNIQEQESIGFIKVPKELAWFLLTYQPLLSQAIKDYEQKGRRSIQDGNVYYPVIKSEEQRQLYEEARERSVLYEGFQFDPATSVHHFDRVITTFFAATPVIEEEYWQRSNLAQAADPVPTP